MSHIPLRDRMSVGPSLDELAAAEKADEGICVGINGKVIQALRRNTVARVENALSLDAPDSHDEFTQAVHFANALGRGDGARAACAQLKGQIDAVFLLRLAECSSARPDEAPLLRELHTALSTLFTG